MPLDPIQRRPISDPLRADFQERVARAVETDPEPFLAAYRAHPDTHGGRYVAADMMKEVFPEFSASREGRSTYNIPLHNSAAVLASEQFRRAVADARHPERDTAIFLTGIPGAGKTSAILDNNQLQRNVRVVYEGQLATPGPAIAKIQAALDAGLKVRIVAIHLQPEVALENTFGRFEREGRGAGVVAMASVQGNLPIGLTAIHEHFGEKVSLSIFDRRDGMNATKQLAGWGNLAELGSEGDYERIKHRINATIDRHEAAGTASPAAIREARGLPPLARDRSLHLPDARQSEHPPTGSAARPQHPQLPAAGVQPGAVNQETATPPPSPTPGTYLAAAGFQGEPSGSPITVRFGDRDNTVSIDPVRPGQPAPTLRLHDAATGEPGNRITADAPRHAPEPGNVLVKNYGENTGMADALARSGAFTPQKEVLGGMMVEMKVVHPALKTHLHRHEQGRNQSRESNPGSNRARRATAYER